MKPLFKNLILLLVCLGIAGCSGNLFSISDQAELSPVPSEPGTYVVDVLARWKDRGDQFIAFKVKVE
ncbi:hypothetical protein [Alkalihalobacillus sp. TS-13]|uniref:hypothetical protein n=1 Tax=Alkalihalobacillus sp. TS-13 TaxID=2842455 RepID=UPI001C86FF9C|nr:hypothetical protein [Alkalihalobacillus sp. TS-13]